MSGVNVRDGRQPTVIGRRQVITAAGAALLAAAAGVPSLGRSAPSVAGTDEQEVRRYQRERKYVQTRYGRIAFVERGQGEAVLLLHGFPLNSFQWRGVIPLLCGKRRCLAPDFMGLGFTEVPSGQSVAAGAQADMLAAFLDTLGVRRVDIIANDSGGAVAQLFVSRYGERVRTLLLTNCDVEPDSPPASVLPVIDDARGGMYTELWLKPWLKDKANLRSSNAFGRLCYSDPSHPTDAAIAQYLGPLVASPERTALTNRFAASLAPNPLAGITDSLRRCQVPTRIVWGMSDRIFSPDNIQYLVSVLSRVTGICKLPEAKLFFPEELPEVIADEATTLWMDQV